MSSPVWVASFGANVGDRTRTLRDLLTRRGIASCEDPDNSECTAAIVVFDADDDGLLPFVQQEIASRELHVLGIAADPESLTPERLWALLSAGFLDAIRWTEPVESLCSVVAARLARWGEIDAIVGSTLTRKNLIGKSRAWLSALRGIIEAARYSDAPILLAGESGTGKELCARLIHALNAREKRGELTTVDCTTIMPELSGSEFFGHERGSYTGAAGARDGAFALADGGTLFLDEIGELPLRLQAQLLRVVQEGRYKRVGSSTWRKSSFRLVSATNRDLAAEVERGTFRSDLYYRIAGCGFVLPPLRERREDILPLAQHFLREALGGEEPPGIDPAVQAFLLDRDFPGNVRDLRQFMGRVALRHVDVGPVTAGDIPLDERPAGEDSYQPLSSNGFEAAVRRALSLSMGLKDIGRSATETAIRIAISEENGNIARAARRLCVTPRALQLRVADRRSHMPAERRASGDARL